MPDQVAQLTSFSLSVAFAAASTVILATRLGFPISTTHALTGALVGTGLLASSEGVNFAQLNSAFVLPLILSPFIAIAGTVVLYPILSYSRKRMGIMRESCLCVGNEVLMAAPPGTLPGSSAAMVQISMTPTISIGTTVSCEERYVGKIWDVSAKSLLDTAHFLSAGLVGFARGMNDTPKIAAILIVGSFMTPLPSIVVVSLAMAAGGIFFARRIAETMSHQITSMNDGQGFTANLVTSAIVIGASNFGLPVSTTHVSCGALFGIGAVTKQAHWGAIVRILLAWVITLPVAGALGFIGFYFLRGVL